MTASRSWFQDEALLLGEIRRARSGGGVPVIAGYDELREIKRGGQGIVYSAVQRSTKRRVALKLLLDSAYYSASGQRRFQREVDLAAALHHPGIVRVYDSGLTKDGRAYLVMEYAEGIPLDEYVAQSPGDIDRTLEAFLNVCDAIQHAHTKGVIHRDLKPSNVRVDVAGTPRVLDFGLAKIGDDKAASDSGTPLRDATLTTTGQFVGSLPWASPEQARGEHNEVDTRTDVYSLGVMLYQLVTGKFPYEVAGPLHTALANIVTATPAPARQVRAAIDEQLETILGKALAKQPADRYQSVGDMADDVRHHLAGEPIRAKRESAWRSLQRTAHRFRLAAAAGAVVLAAVTVASVVSLTSANTAREQRGIAEAEAARAKAESENAARQAKVADDERGKAIAAAVLAVTESENATRHAKIADEERGKATAAAALAKTESENATREAANAKRERGKADATVTFLTDLLRNASPATVGGSADAKVIDAVNRAASTVDNAYEKDPATLAELHTTLGSIYTGLDNTEKGRFHFNRAADIYEGLPDVGPNDRRSIRARSNAATTFAYEGKYAETIPLMLAAIERYKTVPMEPGATSDSDLPNAYTVLGVSLRRMGRAQEAIDAYNAGLALLTEEERAGRAGIVFRNNIASAYQSLSRYAEAEAGYKGVIEAWTKHAGEEYSETITAKSNLATLYLQTGSFQEALDLLVALRPVSERNSGPDHKSTLFLMNNIANAHEQLGQIDEAIAIYEDVVARYRKKDDGNVEVCVPLSNVAGLYVKANRPAEAVAAARESLALAGAKLGPDNITTLSSTNTLGVVLSRTGAVEESVAVLQPLYERTRPGSTLLPDGDHRRWAFASAYAFTLHLAKRTDEAVAIQKDAFEKLKAGWGEKHFSTQRAATNLVTILDEAGRTSEADEYRPFLPPKP